MALKISTGLRNKMLDTGSFKSVMASGKIIIYSGTVPADADAAVTGTPLVEITVDGLGTGITMDTSAASGTIAKNTGEVWKGTVATTGVATHYRHVASGDDGTLSTTQARVQGLVSTAGAEMNISNVSLVSGAEQTVDYYNITLPTL